MTDEHVEQEAAAGAAAGDGRRSTTACSASPPTSTTTRSARRASAQEYVTLANERLLKELLPILDDLERALSAAEQHEEAQLEEGVRLVHRSLASLLERQGVKEIATEGKFDPHVHEALLAQPSEEAEQGDVLDVIQKGYKLGDRVVRPARGDRRAE